MEPIYTPHNTKPAYQLNWALTIFWRDRPIPDDDWFDALQSATEPDGVRVLKHRITTRDASQFFVSTRPHVAPSQLVRSVKGRLQHLRGDVETIVHNALEKDRDRRYRSAAELADDIRRYLGGEAIRARPPSIVYQFQVLVRRNKAICGAIAAVLAVLVAGIVVSTALYLRSARARTQAITQREQTRQAKDEAVAVADFLIGMFEAVDPASVGKTVSVKAMLDDAARRLDDGALTNPPLVEASIRELLGDTYEKLNISDQAEAQFRIALSIRRRIQGSEHRDTLLVSRKLAEAYSGRP